MPLQGIPPPGTIRADRRIRLSRHAGALGFACAWYQVPGTVRKADGETVPGKGETRRRTHGRLDIQGALTFIEIRLQGKCAPVRDVCLSPGGPPFVTGDRKHRVKGKEVHSAPIQGGWPSGFSGPRVREIHGHSLFSKACLDSPGFGLLGKTARGGRCGTSLATPC